MENAKLKVGDKIRVKFDFPDAEMDDDCTPRYLPGNGYSMIDDIRETNFIWIINKIENTILMCSPMHMPGADNYVIYKNEAIPFREDRRIVI